jgi:outer membrane protein assembly factor BamB
MTQPRDHLLARNCPNCGASIEWGAPGAHLTCRYCGHAFDVPAAAPVAPPPQQRVIVVNAPNLAASVAAGASIVRTVVLVVGILIALSAAGISTFVAKQAKSTLNLPIPGVVSALTASFLWDTVAGPPIPAAVGTGGVEGFVGRIRSRPGDELWIAVFEGAKLGQLWKAGPFGTYSEGYRSTYTSVVGRVVVVTDYRATVHVYDLATGKEARSLKLSDRAKSMCASPDGKARVFIELSDEKNILFDADQGTAAPTARPTWCPDNWATSDDCRGWLKRGPPLPACRGPEVAPKVSGFQTANVVEDGDLAVALGKKHPGTAVPVAVGFDPRNKAVRWEQPVGSGDQASVAESSTISIMDALSDGRFVAPYEMTTPKGWHVTAFDARSGQRIWDQPLQPLIGVDHPEGFSLSPTRLYVMRTSSVEIYDARTGKFVGAVGM